MKLNLFSQGKASPTRLSQHRGQLILPTQSIKLSTQIYAEIFQYFSTIARVWYISMDKQNEL